MMPLPSIWDHPSFCAMRLPASISIRPPSTSRMAPGLLGSLEPLYLTKSRPSTLM